MSENDGKIHTVYMRDPLKIKSQNLPYKKTDLYGRISRGFPGPCRGLVLVEGSLLVPHTNYTNEGILLGYNYSKRATTAATTWYTASGVVIDALILRARQ